MTPFDLLLIIAGLCGVLFLGGLWADRYDAKHREARKRNRR